MDVLQKNVNITIFTNVFVVLLTRFWVYPMNLIGKYDLFQNYKFLYFFGCNIAYTQLFALLAESYNARYLLDYKLMNNECCLVKVTR